VTTADGVVRLFCLPNAGAAAASYADWSGRLGPRIEVVPVDLSGHGRRSGDPQLSTMPTVVANLMTTLAGQFGLGPFALFGHSLGASAAVALATECIRRGGPSPLGLVLSAPAPPRTHVVGALDSLTDEELVRLSRRTAAGSMSRHGVR